MGFVIVSVVGSLDGLLFEVVIADLLLVLRVLCCIAC